MPNKLNKSMMNSPYFAGYSNSNAAKPQSTAPKARVPAYAPSVSRPNRPQQSAAPKAPQVQTIPLTRKEQRKLNRAKRRNKNYFFVMRRGICATMFICFLLYILVFAVSFLNISPINGFVSLFTVPDNTTMTERWEYEEQVDEDGYNLEYEDKSEYISIGDPLMGFIDTIKGLLGLDVAEEDAAIAEEETPDTEEPAEEIEEEETVIEYYKDFLLLMEDRQSDFDITTKIAYLIFKYFPAMLLLAALTALIAVFTSFGAARGRRIYRGFALAAIIMLLAGVAALAAGFTLSNAMYGNPLGLLDFGNLQSFLMRGVMGPPYSPVEALETPSLQLVSGFLLWAMLILPVIVLVLSLFTKKKVSYRIFDK